jgi:hypothetical protein
VIREFNRRSPNINLFPEPKSEPLPEPAGRVVAIGGTRTAKSPIWSYQNAQLLGFSLNEIRELFSIQRHPHETCVHVRDLIGQKIEFVRGKMAELRRLETALAATSCNAERRT